MADLVAQGPEAQQRWRRTLPHGEEVLLGRAAGPWSVRWDEHISRQHVRLRWTGSRLEVSRLDEARNPVFFRGSESTVFALRPGEHFVIGQTSFTLTDQRANVTTNAPPPFQQQAFSPQLLKQVRFRNPDHRLEVLSRLPQVLAGAHRRAEIGVGVIGMLLAGVPRADTAAIVSVSSPGNQPGTATTAEVLYWDQRLVTGGDFQPSERLIMEVMRRQQSVLHVWEESQPAATQPFTARRNVDWAICTPIPGEAYHGWTIYLSGRFAVDAEGRAASSDAGDFREDVKFTELVAAAVGSLGRMRLLERQQANLGQFFSPVVLETLSVEDPELVLAPKETDVSVMFCDLRGFSLETERHAHELIELLDRVSQALGVMTREVLDWGGVVGDFQGDAVMGFWGWPLPQPDAVLRTCRAALGIRRQFATVAAQRGSPLAGFHVGLGIATGKAVAGKIGTTDQVKVTVFGPVVNVASRLEGMTRVFHAPILLDATTAEAVCRQVPSDVARVRRLAVVRPYGMDVPLEVSELLPPEAEYPLLTDEHIACCDAAVAAFVAGRWPEAFELLHRTPTEDRVTDFLTAHIAQRNRTPPAGWDGVISLSTK